MKEEYIHYIWKFGTYDSSDLRTLEGDKIEILDKGIHNSNAGPDFLNAKLKIGDTIWVGNVEMHIKSSDWDRHLHQKDPAYNNVILHVVLLHDKDILNSEGNSFPTLSLSTRIDKDHYGQYNNLISSRKRIACAEHLPQVDPFEVSMMKEKAIINRLQRKTQVHLQDLERTNNDWQQLLYEMLAANFGFKINKEPFEELAKRTPLKLLLKHIDKPLQIEALIIGQAGLLNSKMKDAYPRSLYEEYHFLKQKYDLIPIKASSWKFMRMRPANFPTIRLAQFAAFLIKNRGFTDLVFDELNKDEWRKKFDLEIHPYWTEHFRFDVLSKAQKKSFGSGSYYNVVINTISRFLFVQGEYRKDHGLKEKALGLLLSLPAEENAVTSMWKDFGVSSQNSSGSQALIELKDQWCDQKRCLNCSIGIQILKSLNANA